MIKICHMFIKRTRGGSKAHPIYYLQIVESYREKDKTRHRVLANLGREEELIARGALDNLMEKLAIISRKYFLLSRWEGGIKNALTYGPMLVINFLWDQLKMKRLLFDIQQLYKIEFDFELAVKLMISNRLINPLSKLGIDKWKENIYGESFDRIELHHLYRSLDIVAEHKDMIERSFFEKTRSLFKSVVRVVFYDLTTLYFESQQADALRKYGYSKENKTDSVQVVIGLVINQDGLPISYYLFPGNTFEGKTVVPVLEKLRKDFLLEKIVFVGDKGIVSERIMEELSSAGYEYIISAKISKISEKYHQKILSREKYIAIDENISTWQINIGGQRLVLGYSKQRAERDKTQRELLLERLQKKLERSDKPKSLTKSAYNSYLKVEGDSRVVIDQKQVLEKARWDGFFGFYTNNHSMSNKEIVLTYQMLWQIENSFRILKSTLDLRPVYHWTKKRIEGHIMICFLSLYMLRAIEFKLNRQEKLNLSTDEVFYQLDKIKAVTINAFGKKVIMRTEITDENNLILRSLGIKIPNTILEEIVVE
ncbi:MAG: IS1634 family transposase [Candidatus Jordarchaeum sp.]|uniref:IS1634 family transposase n=1 Tax=Candidatus Jordarchaeum sp. TaxID=2823881 RepID=UPI0040492DFC